MHRPAPGRVGGHSESDALAVEKEYFKLKWLESGHRSSMGGLNGSSARFIDYIRDKTGTHR